jgi:hypothetical protein
MAYLAESSCSSGRIVRPLPSVELSLVDYAKPRHLGLVLSAQIEEIHGFRDVKQAVGVIFQTEFLSSVIEVRLNEKVRAKRGLTTRIRSSSSKALFPFRSASVSDRCNLAQVSYRRGVGSDCSKSRETNSDPSSKPDVVYAA